MVQINMKYISTSSKRLCVLFHNIVRCLIYFYNPCDVNDNLKTFVMFAVYPLIPRSIGDHQCGPPRTPLQRGQSTKSEATEFYVCVCSLTGVRCVF